MSNKTLPKKLSFNKETILPLTDPDSAQAVVGGKVYTNYTCGEEASCYNTNMHICLSLDAC